MATWNIAQLDRRTSDGFVTTAHWTCSDVDGEFSGSAYGAIGLEGVVTTPYEDITEEQAIGWVKSAMGEETVAATEESVATQIEAQRNPVQASGKPW
jgi:hypothetical protein